MKRYYADIIKALSYLTQVGLTAIIPIFIWIYVAGLIREKFSLGNYIIIIGILLGIASSYVSLYKLFKAMNDNNKINKSK
jgi:hypothetical protein